METIFDHNVTREELIRFVGPYSVDRIIKEKPVLYKTENDANYALGILFSMRGDIKKARNYFDKITNPEILKNLSKDF